MNAITAFDFEENAVRSMTGADGEPWFVGKDVCQCLEIKDHHQALRKLDEDERGMYNVHTPRGDQNMKIVNEPGIYQLIFTSRTDAAKRFKKWIAHVVLPAIRKTGQYVAPANEDRPDVSLRRVKEYDLAAVRAYAPWQKEVRLIHGKEAARQYMKKLPVPQVDDLARVEVIIRETDDLPDGMDQAAFNELLDGQACLDHLLAQTISPHSDKTVDAMLMDGLHGGINADIIKSKGMMISPPGWNGYLAIGCRHKFLTACFAGTAWHADWVLALLTLRSARATQDQIMIERLTKCVMIPISSVLARQLT